MSKHGKRIIISIKNQASSISIDISSGFRLIPFWRSLRRVRNEARDVQEWGVKLEREGERQGGENLDDTKPGRKTVGGGYILMKLLHARELVGMDELEGGTADYFVGFVACEGG